MRPPRCSRGLQGGPERAPGWLPEGSKRAPNKLLQKYRKPRDGAREAPKTATEGQAAPQTDRRHQNGPKRII
eukprot:4371546-Pyramimonas_sp.AAC.1